MNFVSEVLPFLLGGLVLFLFSIYKLSRNLNLLFGQRAKELIAKYTDKLFKSLLIGIVLTILLDSSSAVIILAIVFINANALKFRHAIGIIMGANIGTTVSSQIIAMDIAHYSALIMAIAFALEFVVKKEKHKYMVRAIYYFGMLFFGLYIMENSVLPLKDSSFFENYINRIGENAIQGTLTGGLVTLIIQSSSATVGIAIILAKQNLISSTAGIAVMLGAELGTCANTLIATVKGNRQAVKSGLFHLFFNLSSIIIGLIFFHAFVDLVLLISGDAAIDKQIANAHVLFNILGVIVFLPFVNTITNLFNMILPDQSRFESHYFKTDYYTEGEHSFSISIGNKTPELDAFLKTKGYESWAFISAENPASIPLAEKENLKRRAQLENILNSESYEFIHGKGKSRTGDWPAENSLLILNISKQKSMSLAKEFGQNAFVYAEAGQSAELVWVY